MSTRKTSHKKISLGTNGSAQSVVVEDGQLALKNISQTPAVDSVAGIDNTDKVVKMTLPTYSIKLNTGNTNIELQKDGTTISSVDVSFLNDEGSKFEYNAAAKTLELKNKKGVTLSSIPVSSLVSKVANALQLSGNTISLLDSTGEELSNISLEIGNVNNLEAKLYDKQDKLVPGTNISTIMGLSLMQAGNLGMDELFPGGRPGYYLNHLGQWAKLDKAAVGLDKVDNTSDEDKPLSNELNNWRGYIATIQKDGNFKLNEGGIPYYPGEANMRWFNSDLYSLFSVSNSNKLNRAIVVGSYEYGAYAIRENSYTPRLAFSVNPPSTEATLKLASRPWNRMTNAELVTNAQYVNNPALNDELAGSAYYNMDTKQLMIHDGTTWTTIGSSMYTKDGTISTNRTITLNANIEFVTNSNSFKISGLQQSTLDTEQPIVVADDGTLKKGSSTVINLSASDAATATNLNISSIVNTTNEVRQPIAFINDPYQQLSIMYKILKDEQFTKFAQSDITLNKVNQQIATAAAATLTYNNGVFNYSNKNAIIQNFLTNEYKHVVDLEFAKELPIDKNWVIAFDTNIARTSKTGQGKQLFALIGAKDTFSELIGAYRTNEDSYGRWLNMSTRAPFAETNMQHVSSKVIMANINRTLYLSVNSTNWSGVTSLKPTADITKIKPIIRLYGFSNVFGGNDISFAGKYWMDSQENQEPTDDFEARYNDLVSKTTLTRVPADKVTITALKPEYKSTLVYENDALVNKRDTLNNANALSKSAIIDLQLPKTKRWRVKVMGNQISYHVWSATSFGFADSTIDKTVYQAPELFITSNVPSTSDIQSGELKTTVNSHSYSYSVEYAHLGNGLMRVELRCAQNAKPIQVSYMILSTMPAALNMVFAAGLTNAQDAQKTTYVIDYAIEA